MRKEPTTISHCSSRVPADFVPCDDDGIDGDLDAEDYDGYEVFPRLFQEGKNIGQRRRSQCSGMIRRY